MPIENAIKNPHELLENLNELHPSDIAYSLKKIENESEDDFFYVLKEIPDEILGEVILELPDNLRDDVYEHLTSQRLSDVVDELDSDDATDIIQEIEEARKNPEMKGQPVEGWENAAKKFAENGIILCAINSSVDNEISLEHHQKMKEIFGRQWFGHNEGEWDGAYFQKVARGQFELSATRSRQEALEHYLNWLEEAYEKHHHYMATVSSLGFGCHYAAELGSRIMGLELGEGLPSDTVLWAFCRGASRQYDLLTAVFPSVFSRRGGGIYNFKCYPKEGQPKSFITKGSFLAGPDHGSTLGLLKRLWWISYMNGASIIGLQFGLFPCDLESDAYTHGAVPIEPPLTEKKLKAHFTPLGWLFWEASETAKRHPDRGVSYNPFAIMLPWNHGWMPQPNCYAPEVSETIWGNIPYDSADYQIERFFQKIYPGFQKANNEPTRDERGKITNTPFGDSFDVILSNAEKSCLEKYQVLIMLGALKIDENPELAEKLKNYASKGGIIVVDSGQWKFPPGDFDYSPSIKHCTYGKGEIYYVQTPFWGDENEFETHFTSLFDHLNKYQLISIKGRPIYYSVNVTDKPDELRLTLCNNSQALQWDGIVEIPGQEIIEVEEWLAFGEVHLKDGKLHCGVPANDIRIFTLKTATPFLNLKEAEHEK